MTQKLILLVAGSLITLAFATAPVVASAGEFHADCETGSSCSGTISGGVSELVNTANEGIRCSSTSGTANITSGSSTGTIKLSFFACRENITIFQFTCTNTSTSGTIETNNLVFHLVYLEPEHKTPGILITGANVTFNCAGFAKKTVTGNVIGHITNPNCGTYQWSHSLQFDYSFPAGYQKFSQVTTTGEIFRLQSNNDAGGAYLTSSEAGSGAASWLTKVKLAC